MNPTIIALVKQLAALLKDAQASGNDTEFGAAVQNLTDTEVDGIMHYMKEKTQNKDRWWAVNSGNVRTILDLLEVQICKVRNGYAKFPMTNKSGIDSSIARNDRFDSICLEIAILAEAASFEYGLSSECRHKFAGKAFTIHSLLKDDLDDFSKYVMDMVFARSLDAKPAAKIVCNWLHAYGALPNLDQ